METKHTKGEWKKDIHPFYYYKDDVRFAIYNETNGTIAACFGKTGEEAEANAKLIAAAPKLLEALIELKSQFCGEKTPERLAAYKAELAIKSATE